MKKAYKFVVVFFLIPLMLIGCTPSGGNTSNDIENYKVEIIELTEPMYESIRTENIKQPNCTGTGEVDNVIERTMGINHSIVVGFGLAVDVDGKLEVLGTGVDLGTEISRELGFEYGTIESITRSITVRAAPKTHMMHTIQLSEVWEAGTARVTVGGQSTEIPFRYRANFSIDLIKSVPIDCVTGQAESVIEASCQIPVHATYNFSRSDITQNFGPGLNIFYDHPGGGSYSNDQAGCEISPDCTQLRAYNKDSADPNAKGVTGSWVDAQSGISTAKWDQFTVQCEFAD